MEDSAEEEQPQSTPEGVFVYILDRIFDSLLYSYKMYWKEQTHKKYQYLTKEKDGSKSIPIR